MDCTIAKTWLFRRLDDELSHQEGEQLDLHLLQCAACTREMRMLMIPRTMARSAPMPEVSPYFYSKLRARIRSDSLPMSLWQVILGISRQVVPALGAVTLAILVTFAYLQIWSPTAEADLYQAFDGVFTSGDHSRVMVIVEQGEITDESVLMAIADQETTP